MKVTENNLKFCERININLISKKWKFKGELKQQYLEVSEFI